jgi:hypothetical protein
LSSWANIPFWWGQKDPMICLSLAKSLVGTVIAIPFFGPLLNHCMEVTMSSRLSRCTLSMVPKYFFAIIETPGTGNVFRIVYTAIVEFSLSCNLELFCVEEGSDDMFVVSEEQGTESASRFFILDRETILLCPRTNPPHKCVCLNDTTKNWKRNETGFIAM